MGVEYIVHSNLKPHVASVTSSFFDRGYFLQTKGLIEYAVQYDLLSLNFKNGHTFGSLQHAPQLTHSPFLCFEIGRMQVIVLFIFAGQLFFIFSFLAQVSSADSTILFQSGIAEGSFLMLSILSCSSL